MDGSEDLRGLSGGISTVPGFHYFVTEYLGPSNQYFGSIVGRVANRIGKGTFSIDGQEYNVTLNKGTYHLHGGTKGFDKVSQILLITILFFVSFL